VDSPVAVEAALRECDKRHAVPPNVDRALGADHPAQAFAPSGNSAAFTGITLEQNEVEVTAIKLVAQVDTEIATHVEP
jgi:hypothetical protein